MLQCCCLNSFLLVADEPYRFWAGKSTFEKRSWDIKSVVFDSPVVDEDFIVQVLMKPSG
jgi:hypothetical protein